MSIDAFDSGGTASASNSSPWAAVAMSQAMLDGTPPVVAFRGHTQHPPLANLMLLVFEAVLEVVCVSAPGYLVARMGMFDAEMQKFVANLNVMLFTPCLIFNKLASQLTLEKMAELAVIPVIFVIMTAVSFISALIVSRVCGFKRRPRNFVIAMAVFGNSNSLPISLVISLSKTLPGLKWDKIPRDNSDEVAARGILYLLIFQQLGQLVRWSWGYNVLLAPKESYPEEIGHMSTILEEGDRYRDDPEEINDEIRTAEDTRRNKFTDSSDSTGTLINNSQYFAKSHTELQFASGGMTPVNTFGEDGGSSSEPHSDHDDVLASKPQRRITPEETGGHPVRRQMTAADRRRSEREASRRTFTARTIRRVSTNISVAGRKASSFGQRMFEVLPRPLQKVLGPPLAIMGRFLRGLWAFMNPPLWAMLAAIIVATIPALQRLLFTKGTFVNNSIISAIAQNGGVAVPLILVVLGANLARNTLPQEAQPDQEETKIETKLMVACIVSRMVIPTILVSPILAVAAKFVPVSILDDPIFVVVMFLLIGAPSALQLAQICQINNVYQGVMAKLLFQSYVIWILPSTLVLVGLALEVVEWANVK